MHDDLGLGRLLDLAAKDAPISSPPSVAEFVMRRAHRRRHRLALVAAVCVTALVAVGIAFLPRGGTPRPGTAGAHPTGVTAAELRTYRWRSIPAGPLDARSDSVAVWTGSQLIIWGGDTDTELFPDGAAFDPLTRRWQLLPESPLGARVSAAATVVGGQVFIWGGKDGRGPLDWTTGGALYDPIARRWQLLPALDTGTYSWARAVTVDGSVVLLYANTDALGTSTVVHAATFDPGTFRWHALPELALPDHHPAGPLSAAAVGTNVYLWSNWAWETRTSDGVEIASGIDARTLDLRSRRWSVDDLGPHSGEQIVDAQSAGSQILLPVSGVYCGACKGPPPLAASGYLVDPASGRTTKMSPGWFDDLLPEYVWTGAAAITYQLGDYTAGPGTQRGDGQAEAWDPATNSWTVLHSAPRTGPNIVAVWTGTELIEWGSMYAVGSTDPAAESHPAGLILGPA